LTGDDALGAGRRAEERVREDGPGVSARIRRRSDGDARAERAPRRAGYDFYALELRKYGRSLDGAAHPNFCKEFTEYFPEITWALDIITTSEGWVGKPIDQRRSSRHE
jgi:hypothetical protein